jgi:hypothetical protein
MATSTADGKEESGLPVEKGDHRGVPARSGTSAAVKGEPAPRLPHEQDESSDSGTSAPRPIVEQAANDVRRGVAPTDKSQETDEVYGRTLRGPPEQDRRTADPASDGER